MTTTYSMRRLRSTYSKLVELNRLDDVFLMTISLGCGASASMTSASGDPLATKMPEIL